MNADPEYVLRPLRKDADFILHRGTEHGNRMPVLVLVAANPYSPPHVLRRLEHEYSLAEHLDASWSAQPLLLTRREGSPILILKDPGGELLDQIIERHKGQPIDVAHALRIGIGLTAAVSQAHRRGLVHKDIKPANALVDEAGRAWLTGFGFASRLPRERVSPGPTQVIAGTFAYMAPEQSGRMNRSIDLRSDLYSLGVTLYQMLTGALPFTATDDLEWVHCHIAQRPVAPADRAKLPAPLSAIVMKLLAKNPEERYQSASGLEADLRRCLSEWQSRGSVDLFPLGTNDSRDKLVIPEKLYGREREVEALLAAFEKVATRHATGLVLISGYSGVGKSSVVNELQKALLPARGLYGAGKFEQYKRDVPYATFSQAFQMLVRQVLMKSEPEIKRWRERLLEALGANGQLIVNLIPELEFIIGKQEPVPDLAPQEARNRFQLVFRNFLGVFATPEHALVLFLDDLQWLDDATLRLLEYLATDTELRHLLLVGAYRDNEVTPSHPLTRTLAAVSRAGVKAENIVLAPLKLKDVEQLIAEALQCLPGFAHPLALLIQAKTAGNPFFATNLLTSLADDGLLWFEEASAAWSWDVDRIHATSYSDNVVDLMATRVRRLPRQARSALQQMACLGNLADIATLSVALEISEEEVHTVMWPGVRSLLVERLPRAYRFAHDRIQEAAYSLITPDLRAHVHLRIGRLLVAHASHAEQSEAIFEMVSQLNRGSHLITDVDERALVAALNLSAGKRAKASTAYASALNYLHAARALLDDAAWHEDRELAFSTESLIAECELLTADMPAAESRLSRLAERVESHREAAVVTRLQVTLYTTLDRSDRAIDIFLDYLGRNGTDWKPHPSRADVVHEYARIWSLVGDRQIEDLLDLPLLVDPDVLDMLDVFAEIVHPAMFFDENLSTLVVCRMVTLCLQHGNCDASCFGYVWFGMFAGPRFDNYKDGFRFGQLGYDLVEKRGLTRYKARTYISFATLTPWAKHALEGRELVRRAFDVAYRTGDLTFSAYSWHVLITNYLAVGDALEGVQGEAEKGLDFVRKAGFGLVVENCAAQLGLVRTLRGLTPTFGCMDNDEYSEMDTERRLARNPTLALAEFFYWTRKLQARYLARDLDSALASAANARRLLWPAASQVETGDFHFFAALAHAAAWRESAPDESRMHLARLHEHGSQLEVWARHCPANFATRTALVSGEIARVEGRILEAEQLYETAIRAAHEAGFAHCEAIANECAGEFYLARGFPRIAHVYLMDSRNCFTRWGADGKVKQLTERHPLLRGERMAGSGKLLSEETVPLDLGTIVNASQALSSEMFLPKLIESLVRIAILNAGAQRGLLILSRNEELKVEAEATTSDGKVKVTIGQSPNTSAGLPQTILNYVTRTRATVLLDDASTDETYSTDEYVRDKHPRSVLCLPIVNQAKLIGVLYLENNLASGAFTPDRVAVLRLLASQAAISLVNAALYTDLQLQVGLLGRLPVSAWTLKPDGTPDYVNQVWLDFSGHTRDFVQSHPEAWMSAVHPDDRELATGAFWEGVRSGKGFTMETRNLRAEDGTYRWHLQRAVPLHDSEGKVLKFVGTTTDVDEQKRTEEALRQAQSDLARINRVTTMGELAASLAHELSQPISGAMTNADVCLAELQHDGPDLGRVRTAVDRIARDTGRATDMIRRIRSQFLRSSPNREVIDVNEIIRETAALLRDQAMRHDISIRTQLAADLPSRLGDRVQLQQVAMNLIVNSIEATKEMEGRREITIQSKRAEGQQIHVSIGDSGVGFDPGLAEQLFDAFFTTKPQGTGMGLRISRSIVESHGGLMWAAGAPGRGATFHFTLPATDGTE
jgi:PAS domain S-box-containing protein